MNPLAVMYASAQLATSAHVAALALCWYAWSPGPYRGRETGNVVPLRKD